MSLKLKRPEDDWDDVFWYTGMGMIGLVVLALVGFLLFGLFVLAYSYFFIVVPVLIVLPVVGRVAYRLGAWFDF